MKNQPLAMTLRAYAQTAPSLMRPHLAAAADAVEENAKLRAERDEARADARRYRWLREHLPQGTLNDCDVDDASSWDAAIDAALKDSE